jgi:hypothetical protein
MSSAEVAHRLARGLRSLSQKFTSHEIPPRNQDARDLRFLPPFIAIAPEHLTTSAERVLAGHYTFFDLEDCALGDPLNWNRDPLTQRVAGNCEAAPDDGQREVGHDRSCRVHEEETESEALETSDQLQDADVSHACDTEVPAAVPSS